jgi:hypothetical protein
MKIEPKCKALGIGSVPYLDGKSAWERISQNFPQVPFWPQLPKRIFLENMYTQFSEHLPGRKIELEAKRFFIDDSEDHTAEMEEFFNDYLTEDPKVLGMSRDYCEGIYSGLELVSSNKELFENAEYIKGQITGPVSFGLQVTDSSLKSILYNDMFHDIYLKNLERKAQWQEMMLAEINENVIMSVDEPYLSTLGSGIININRQQVIDDLETIFKALKCVKASHCCGNTDWSLLMKTSADILLFDAYNYSNNLALYLEDLQEFLSKGGCIGWGIVPTTAQDLKGCTLDGLINRLEEGIGILVNKGLDRDLILDVSFITPSCGMGTLSIDDSELAMQLTSSISKHMREKYELGD